jgi:hypothetical protein
VLFLVERNSEMIIDSKLLTPVGGFNAMLEDIPAVVLSMLLQQPSKPKGIFVQSERLFSLLNDFLSGLDVNLIFKPNLKILNEVRKMLEMSMR